MFGRIPPLGAPSPAIGVTSSVPLNVTAGTAFAAATNVMTWQAGGVEVAGVAAFASILFQGLKQFEWFDQHRWWPFALLAITIPIFWFGTHDLLKTLIDAGLASTQANANYQGSKATGLGLLEPSERYPGAPPAPPPTPFVGKG